MNILYVTDDAASAADADDSAEALAGLVTLRRAQIAAHTDAPHAAAQISAYAVQPADQVLLAGLFAETVTLRYRPWTVQGRGVVVRASYAALLRQRDADDQTAANRIAGLARRWNIDVIHSLTPTVRVGAWAARHARLPHLWQVNTWMGEIGRARFGMKDDMLATWLADQGAIVADSAFCAGLLTTYGIPGVIVLPPAVDPAVFDRPSRDLRTQIVAQAAPQASAGGANTRPIIGMMTGRGAGWRRPGAFVHMAGLLHRLHPDAICVLFGAVDQRVRRAAQAAGVIVIDDGAVNEGLLPDAEAALRLGSLDVLVHPGGQDATARDAVQAMAARVPVIAARSGAVAEWVQDGVTGVVVHPGPDDAPLGGRLAEAVARLLADDGLRRQMGEAGRARVLERHHAAQYAAAMQRVYAALRRG